MASKRQPTDAEERRKFQRQVATASRLKDAHLACRLVGHSWRRIVPDRAPQFGRIVVWECSRCESKRDDIIQPNDGSLLARVYRYAEGYLVEKPMEADKELRGGRQLTAPALRIALLRRDDAHDGT